MRADRRHAAIVAVLLVAVSLAPVIAHRRSMAQVPQPRTIEWRDHPATTLLADGRVLVSGGRRDDGRSFGTPLASAELYDPRRGSWSATGEMLSVHAAHTATLLDDGRVLVAGGFTCTADCKEPLVVAVAELYDPRSGTWTATTPMNAPRSGHIAVRLTDGRVLVISGASSSHDAAALATAEIYDPRTETWTSAAPMPNRRLPLAGFLLPDGRALVLGYLVLAESANVSDPEVAYLSRTGDIFDPRTGTWSTTTRQSCVGEPDAIPIAATGLLPDGTVYLLAGPRLEYLVSYAPATDTWTCRGLSGGAGYHGSLPRWETVVPLGDGRIFAAGGFADRSLRQSTAEASVLDVAAGVWTATKPMSVDRLSHTSVRLADGRVLVFGGFHLVHERDTFQSDHHLTSEVYDPATGTWSPR